MEVTDFGNIALIGDTGKGKTSLCNRILGKDVGKEASTECAGGVTEDMSEHHGLWRGDGPQITVFDMPGFGDTRVKMDTLIDFWRRELRSKRFTAICFVIRLDDHRLSSYQQAALKVLGLCMESDQPWRSIIIVGTHADKLDPDEPSAEQKLNDILKEINKMIKLENAVNRKVSISLKKPKNVPPPIPPVIPPVNPPANPLLEEGLKQLHTHFRELLGREIQIRENIPEREEIQEVVATTTYSDKGSCFDGEMVVKLLKEDKVITSKLSEVKLFEMIQVNDGSFEPVMILSRHINQSILVLEFEVEDKENQKKICLRLVNNHFMYVLRDKKIVHIPARKVTMNDKLLYFSKNATVIHLPIVKISEKVCKDAINVRTQSRTALVNEFCCSSVVEGDAGTIGHWIAMASGKIHRTLPNEITKLAVKLQSIYLRAKNGKI